MTCLPTLTVPAEGQNEADAQEMLDRLEENGDVKEIHHNAEFPGEN